MRNFFKWSVCLIGILLFSNTLSFSQKIETVDGVRVIHNGDVGKWGKSEEISIEFVKTIGDIASEDGNVLFYMPADIAFDGDGNVYVLDSGNHRIQKFNPFGEFITSIGNKGQGPGEFQFPMSLDIDTKGFLYVADMGNQRIQVLTSEGKELKTIKLIKDSVSVTRISKSGRMIMGSGGGVLILGPGGMREEKDFPKLIKILNEDGGIQKDFGDQKDFKHILLNRMGNQFHFIVDKNENTFIAFDYQNRIEKYGSDGKLIWRTDRKLEYSMDPPKNKGILEAGGGRRRVEMPQMNRCSKGVAVDEKGRIWVVSLNRQMREDEQVQTSVMVLRNATGGRNMNISLEGNTDVRKTDMYRLEVYAPDGILLGKISLDHFVDDIHIEKDKIYLLDKMRGMQYYEYRIKE